MTANVKLVVAEKPSASKVPNAALRFRPAGRRGAAQRRPRRSAGGGVRAAATPSPEQIRERLVKGLGLTQEQQKKLEPILQDSRSRSGGFRDCPRASAARRARRSVKPRARASATILTDEQKARYDEMHGGPPARRGAGTAGRV